MIRSCISAIPAVFRKDYGLGSFKVKIRVPEAEPRSWSRDENEAPTCNSGTNKEKLLLIIRIKEFEKRDL